MLKASALFYAIVISLLVGMLTGSLILSAYFNRIEVESYINEEKLQLNAVSGINYLLSSSVDHQGADPVAIDLFDAGSDSVSLQKIAWGVYEIALSSAASNGRQVKLAALAGSLLNNEQKYSLWISDQDRPLSIAGKTVIRGDAYLPKAGVQRAYIEGQSYSGDKMVYGNIKQSSRAIPIFEKSLSSKISGLLTGSFSENDSVINIDEVDTLKRSFFQDAVIVYEAGEIVLNNICLAGHIIVSSSGKITVGANASLNDVILTAPKITVKEGFTGTLQAFASDTLIIEKKCTLLYPSAFGVLRTMRSPDHVLLSVDEGTILRGALIGLQDSYDIRKQLLVQIGKETRITGQVYSSGLADIKGKVAGSVTASRLLLKTPSSVYENHLLDATIDCTALPEEFAGMVMSGRTRTVLKWME